MIFSFPSNFQHALDATTILSFSSNFQLSTRSCCYCYALFILKWLPTLGNVGLHRKVLQQRKIPTHVKLHSHSSFMENTVGPQRPPFVEKNECTVNVMQIYSWQSKKRAGFYQPDAWLKNPPHEEPKVAEVGCIARPRHSWSFGSFGSSWRCTRSHGCHVGTRCDMDLSMKW